jgi:hypothetical protein
MIQSWEEQRTAKIVTLEILLRDSLVDILRFPALAYAVPPLKRERPEEFLSFLGNKTGLFGILNGESFCCSVLEPLRRRF